jgi:DUF4097 and DUF4098 domain-containing protein YvlB
MILIATAALLGALAAAQPATEQRDTRTPQTDQTVPVTRGTRLLVDNFAGEVILHTWDKDAVHVVARHGARSRVTVRPAEGSLSIVSSRGATGSVDYDITAPAWMAVKIEGEFNFVEAQGLQAEFSAESVRGDIVVRGGTGFITAKSVQGEVTIDGARGKINASSVNEGITITNSSGEIVADTTNGDVTLSRIESASVEVTTVNGDVTFDGVPAANGRYRMSTHNGDIAVAVPETSSVTFNVRTYNGEFSSALPTKGPANGQVHGGRRVQFTLGSGSAEMELESFGGEIRLRRPGTIPPKKGKETDKAKDKDKGPGIEG